MAKKRKKTTKKKAVSAKKAAPKKAPAKHKDSNIFAFLAVLFGIVGGIVLYIYKDKDPFVKFYATQSVMLNIIYLIGNMIIGLSFFGPFILLVLTVIAWVILLVKAWRGEKYYLPLIGEWADKYAH